MARSRIRHHTCKFEGGSMVLKKVCVECQRVFDLMCEKDSNEWAYGHDCEMIG